MIISKIEEYILEGEELYNIIKYEDDIRFVDYSELLEIVTNKIGHIDDLIEYKILSSDSVYIKIPKVKIVKDKQ